MSANSTWKLTCLLCGHSLKGLVSVQKHVMKQHGYSQDDLKRQTCNPTSRDPWPHVSEYTYTMPDGKNWLKVERVEEITQ